MNQVAIGLFKSYKNASDAVDELHEEGFSASHLSVIAKEEVIERDDSDNDVEEGAGAGAVVGGLLGLLAGVGAITIPGIGPILTAGTLATALGSTAVGAGLGSVVGALVDLGISEEDATTYAEGLRKGDIIVAVQGNEEEIENAHEIFAKHNAVRMQAEPASEFSSA